jgi:hypothetical protein
MTSFKIARPLKRALIPAGLFKGLAPLVSLMGLEGLEDLEGLEVLERFEDFDESVFETLEKFRTVCFLGRFEEFDGFKRFVDPMGMEGAEVRRIKGFGVLDRPVGFGESSRLTRLRGRCGELDGSEESSISITSKGRFLVNFIFALSFGLMFFPLFSISRSISVSVSNSMTIVDRFFGLSRLAVAFERKGFGFDCGLVSCLRFELGLEFTFDLLVLGAVGTSFTSVRILRFLAI